MSAFLALADLVDDRDGFRPLIEFAQYLYGAAEVVVVIIKATVQLSLNN